MARRGGANQSPIVKKLPGNLAEAGGEELLQPRGNPALTTIRLDTRLEPSSTPQRIPRKVVSAPRTGLRLRQCTKRGVLGRRSAVRSDVVMLCANLVQRTARLFSSVSSLHIGSPVV
ncbi:hypothetical protein Bbelb_100950 [Branchiostoma belcheri]|nr:hypothetical protein Bbelb_100950 [Branchiostoma belcheri]